MFNSFVRFRLCRWSQICALVFWFGVSLEQAHASSCDSLKSMQAVLNCALERHPDVKVADLDASKAAVGQSVAKMRPNPELNSQTTFGGTSSDKFYSEYNFAHTFELGGKRDSRIKRSDADLKLRQAGQFQTREQVYLSTLIALYRLRQIQEEIAANEDALQSFSRIGKQYRSRPKLNPEQTAALRIFEIAEQDYKMRRAPLDAEADLHLRELEQALGQAYVPSADVLPKHKRTWPILEGVSTNENPGGARMQALQAEFQIAQADFSLARSSAWPDLKLGPTVAFERLGSKQYEAYGFNFALPLPLFHRNAAGEALAKTGIERATIALKAAERENEDQRQYFRKRYEGAVKVLSESPSATDLAKKHKEVESLFTRGFLNGTVVVEIHRQVSDFMKTQNEEELAAVESFVRYHALNGKLIEVQE